MSAPDVTPAGPLRAFTLWLPAVEAVPFYHCDGDLRIVRDGGITAAFQSGNKVGVVGLRPVHRIGRRDA